MRLILPTIDCGRPARRAHPAANIAQAARHVNWPARRSHYTSCWRGALGLAAGRSFKSLADYELPLHVIGVDIAAVVVSARLLKGEDQGTFATGVDQLRIGD